MKLTLAIAIVFAVGFQAQGNSELDLDEAILSKTAKGSHEIYPGAITTEADSVANEIRVKKRVPTQDENEVADLQKPEL